MAGAARSVLLASALVLVTSAASDAGQAELGGKVQVRPRYQSDFALDQESDDRLRSDQSLELHVDYEVSERLSLRVEAKAFYRGEFFAADRDTESEHDLQRGETWLYWKRIGGSRFGLQVGRQRFREAREWWWDQDLDAVRVEYRGNALTVELAVAESIARVSLDGGDIEPEDDDVLWILGRTRWKWADTHTVEAFAVHQADHSGTPSDGVVVKRRDEDAVDSDLTWLGLRATGKQRLGESYKGRYWIDVATVFGDELLHDFDTTPSGNRRFDETTHQDVRGWGMDTGATLATEWRLQPRFTIGYAFGSGDDAPASGGTDHSFRQTGLHDNDASFRGVNRFRYYGEMLRPELSNLHIGTVSIGFPFLEQSSIEIVYHYYRQDDATDSLRDAKLDVAPTGDDPAIGQEFDAVIGIEEWEHVEVELAAGLFRAGKAYGALKGELAASIIAQVAYKF